MTDRWRSKTVVTGVFVILMFTLELTGVLKHYFIPVAFITGWCVTDAAWAYREIYKERKANKV